MPSDRSRRTDPTCYGYTGVVAQQGRVILDRDFNAQQGLTADRIAADALDFVGPCGTPDDGFRISVPGGSPPSPPFWTPPVGPQGSPPPEAPGGHGDFLISPGTMYLGGQRVVFPAEQNGTTITYSYLDQPDWPQPPRPPGNLPRFELAYLEVIELEVGAVEDPDLLEVALGGPDTTQRLKLLRRVRRMTVESANCVAAWERAVATWAAEGWAFDRATMQLLPQARLKVGFTQPASTGDPCDPVATGGYLGADNQLIRVRIAGSGSDTHLIWGYDNASFLYRVTSVSSDRTMLTLASDPPDGFHLPQTGQLVEVLGTAAVLAEEPDETDPTGKTQILRVAAEPDGTLRQLAQPYGPATTGDPTNYIVLAKALPLEVANSPLPLFLRVWQAALPLPAGGGTVTIADPTTGISTGVTATISLPGGKRLPDGVFWQIAVRPATPQGVYPEDLLTTPQPPDGLRRWACPLAVIPWQARLGTGIIDCRNQFDNLVTLTRRKPGCCTVSIGPGDVTTATPLQTLIDDAAAQAETVTVCLGGGSYLLPSPLRLDSRHNGMTLESCGGPAVLRADPKVATSLFVDGLVVLTSAQGVTLRDLDLLPPQSAVSSMVLKGLQTELAQGNLGAGANAVFANPTVSFGVRALNAPDLTIEGCKVKFSSVPADRTADLFAAAVFLQGACGGLTVCDCNFSATIAPTYTELSVPTQDAAPAALSRFDEAYNRLTVTESSTSPPSTAAIQLDNRVSTSLELLVTKRLAVNFAAPSGVVATSGVFAAPYFDIATSAPGVAPKVTTDLACALGNATIRDTTFTDLTFASVVFAAASSLRLQDNTVTGGIAGLWIEAPGAISPGGAAEGTDRYYPTAAAFEESLLAVVLSVTAPPPVDPSLDNVLAAETLAELERRLPMLQSDLLVIGNQVNLRAKSANIALYFLLNTQRYGEAAGSLSGLSAIISGNCLSSTAGLDVPVALLTLSQFMPCAITGNVVLNLSTGESAKDLGPSLWLIVEGSENRDRGVPLLSVTGNVLRGTTDLELIPRIGAALPARGWYTYNAVQT